MDADYEQLQPAEKAFVDICRWLADQLASCCTDMVGTWLAAVQTAADMKDKTPDPISFWATWTCFWASMPDTGPSEAHLCDQEDMDEDGRNKAIDTRDAVIACMKELFTKHDIKLEIPEPPKEYYPTCIPETKAKIVAQLMPKRPPKDFMDAVWPG